MHVCDANHPALGEPAANRLMPWFAAAQRRDGGRKLLSLRLQVLPPKCFGIHVADGQRRGDDEFRRLQEPHGLPEAARGVQFLQV